MDPLTLMISEMKRDMREMDNKIDKILAFQWKVIGGSLAVSGLIAFAFELARLVSNK